MSKNLVAICIPCYENYDGVKRLLESIFVQTYENYHIFISDDSKSNNIEDLIADIADYRVTYEKNDSSLGATKNCNRVMARGRRFLSSSRGYIKLMHHDDFFTYSSSLQEMVDVLEKNPHSTMMFSDTLQIKRDGTSKPTFNNDRHYRRLQKDMWYLFKSNCIGAPSATLFRNSDDFRYFDENLTYMVDVDLYMRILQSSSYEYLRKPLVSIGESDSQLTNTCLKNKEMLDYEYQYVFSKYPCLNRAKYRRWLRLNRYSSDDWITKTYINLQYLKEMVSEKIKW